MQPLNDSYLQVNRGPCGRVSLNRGEGHAAAAADGPQSELFHWLREVLRGRTVALHRRLRGLRGLRASPRHITYTTLVYYATLVYCAYTNGLDLPCFFRELLKTAASLTSTAASCGMLLGEPVRSSGD
jgi:hypothetical protein